MSVSGMSMIHCITNHDESGRWFWFSQRIKLMIATTIRHTILPKETSYGSLPLSNLLDWHLTRFASYVDKPVKLSILHTDIFPFIQLRLLEVFLEVARRLIAACLQSALSTAFCEFPAVIDGAWLPYSLVLNQPYTTTLFFGQGMHFDPEKLPHLGNEFQVLSSK